YGQRPLSHKEHHEEGEEAGDEGKIEDPADIDCKRDQEQYRQQRAEESTEIVANTFETECLAAMLLAHRCSDKCVAGPGAAAGAEPVHKPRPQYRRPCSRNA